MNILLIDDEPNLLNMLKRPLIDHSHTITEAHNGKQGWQVFLEHSNTFDVIITDVNMPVLDGIELLTRLREKNYSIPVIIITGSEDMQLSIQVLRLGAFDLLLKPFKAQDLLDILDKLHTLQEHKKRQVEDLPFFTERIEVTIHSQTASIETVLSFLQDRLHLYCQLHKLNERHISVCLHEALVNAIVHGNLGISSSLKDDSPEEFELLLHEREQTPEYAEKTVTILCHITTEHFSFEITDTGNGFNLQRLDDSDPLSMLPTGRGILIITAFMDEVYWNDTGNHITMIKRFSSREAETPTVQ